MDDIFGSAMVVSIIGGTISTVLGGLILALIQNGNRNIITSINLDGCLFTLVKLIAYGGIMAAITPIAFLLITGLSESPILAPVAGIVALAMWIMVAIQLFRWLFLGAKFNF